MLLPVGIYVLSLSYYKRKWLEEQEPIYRTAERPHILNFIQVIQTLRISKPFVEDHVSISEGAMMLIGLWTRTKGYEDRLKPDLTSSDATKYIKHLCAFLGIISRLSSPRSFILDVNEIPDSALTTLRLFGVVHQFQFIFES